MCTQWKQSTEHENLVNTLEVYFRSKGYGWEEEARELAAYLKNRI